MVILMSPPPNNSDKKYTGKNHAGAANSAPYPVSRLAPATELVDLAKDIAEADQTIQSHVTSKLNVIAAQIKSLQQQAHTILSQAQRDQELHRATCTCHRIIGHHYYLYKKTNGQLYFSKLSVDDWQGTPPHEYQGAYRLEADMSWTVVNGDEGEIEKNQADWSETLNLSHLETKTDTD